MPNLFLFVENHNGSFIPLDQKTLITTYEKANFRPFDGACAGVVAALLEKLFGIRRFNPQFFNTMVSTKNNMPSPDRCIRWQKKYERNTDNFLTIFIRKKLGIHQTGLANNEGFAKTPEDLLQFIKPDNIDRHDLILINLTFNLDVKGQTYIQDHKICILKLYNQYIFCEPNYGIAKFNNFDNMKAWLTKEINDGALTHCKPSIFSATLN